MNDFREWLSDNLRYFLLGLGIVCVGIAIFFGVRAVNNLSKEVQVENEAFEVKIQEKEKEQEPKENTKEEISNEEEVFVSPGTVMEEDVNAQDSTVQNNTQVAENAENAQNSPVQDVDQEAENSQIDTTKAEEATNEEVSNQQETEQTDLTFPRVMTVVSPCNLRPNPGYEGNLLGEIPAGSQVEVLEDAKGWYRINFNGQEGYVGARFVS